MVTNNFPLWRRENFSVRPEPVEGWMEKFQLGASSRSCFNCALGTCSMRCSTSCIHAVEHERLAEQHCDFGMLFVTESLAVADMTLQPSNDF
jgi:hypothetical protein